MAIARLTGQDCNNTSATIAVTATFPSPTTAGNLLIAAVESTTGTGSTTMTGWTLAKEQASTTTVRCVSVFYKISTGDLTAVANNASATIMQIHAYEYSGAANPAVLETSNGNSGAASSTAQVTGTITTTQIGDLIFVVAQQTQTNGGGTSWATATLLQGNTTNMLVVGQYLPGTTLTGFQDTASWTTSRRSSAVIVAFQSGTTTSNISDNDTDSVAEATESIAAALSNGDTDSVAEGTEAVTTSFTEADVASLAEATESVTVAVTDTDASAVDEAVTLASTFADDDVSVIDEVEAIGASFTEADTGEVVEGDVEDAFNPIDDDDVTSLAEGTESINAGISNGEMVNYADAEAIIIAVVDNEGATLDDGDSEEIIPVVADITIVANLIENPAGLRLAHARVTFSANYTSGGETFTAQMLGLQYISFATVMPLATGYNVQWANNKLRVYDTTTGLEVAGSTNLSGLLADVAAWQLESPTWRH